MHDDVGCILAAHGSRADPPTNRLIHSLADAVACRLPFREVIPAFHQGTPTFADALGHIGCSNIVVVPVMTSAGYYADVDLPRRLASHERHPQVRIHQTQPVGTHAGMLDLVMQRAMTLVDEQRWEARRVTVALVGHGTPRHRRSRLATERLVAGLGAHEVFGATAAAFIDEDPSIETLPETCRTPCLLVIPFLIGTGSHATADIPRRLGLTGAADASPPEQLRSAPGGLLCDRPIGQSPGLLDLIVDLARTGRDTLASQVCGGGRDMAHG